MTNYKINYLIFDQKNIQDGGEKLKDGWCADASQKYSGYFYGAQSIPYILNSVIDCTSWEDDSSIGNAFDSIQKLYPDISDVTVIGDYIMTFSHPYKDKDGDTVKDGYYFRKSLFPNKWNLGFALEDIFVAYALKRGNSITLEEKIKEMNRILFSSNVSALAFVKMISKKIKIDSTANDIAKLIINEINDQKDVTKRDHPKKYPNLIDYENSTNGVNQGPPLEYNLEQFLTKLIEPNVWIFVINYIDHRPITCEGEVKTGSQFDDDTTTCYDKPLQYIWAYSLKNTKNKMDPNSPEALNIIKKTGYCPSAIRKYIEYPGKDQESQYNLFIERVKKFAKDNNITDFYAIGRNKQFIEWYKKETKYEEVFKIEKDCAVIDKKKAQESDYKAEEEEEFDDL